MIDKLKGMMYGLAIGDALGAAVEFREKGTFPPVTGYRGGGPHGIYAGAWTDDTSMALALADSIAQKGWDTKDQLERYYLWMDEGKYSHNGWCFDIGCRTRSSLNEFHESGRVVAEYDAMSDGNGSIMRLAPVVIAYHNHPDLLEYAAQSSATTHASPCCQQACQFLAELCRTLIGRYEDKPTADEILIDVTGDNFNEKLLSVLHYWPHKEAVGSGYVVDSLHAAFRCFCETGSFEDCVLKAVNLGDDADTTGAVAGQMAGAYYGFSAIPQSLVDGLVAKDMIDLYLNPLLKV